MRIAVQGCCHGELDKIFASVRYIQDTQQTSIDLLIICGDFQAMRNTADLASLACPDKYKHMGTFYQYYSGAKTAPVPTLFVGGNHEASNYLWELYHGGWVCPNIYFLGFAGCIRFGDLRIAGLSGIYKQSHYNDGHYERFPYSDSHVRSIYHVRKFNIFRLAQIKASTDVFLSHDWPTGIAHYGNTRKLLQFKKHFRAEVESNTLGSPPNEYLLRKLKPSFWFAAHLHVKFAALFEHQDPAIVLPAVSIAAPTELGDMLSKVKNPDEINIDDDDDDDEDDECLVQSSDLAASTTHVSTTCTVSDSMMTSTEQEYNVGLAQGTINPTPVSDVQLNDTVAVSVNPDEICISDTDSNDQDSAPTPIVAASKPVSTLPILTPTSTKFLALDKCLPGRDFLQIVDVPTDPESTTPLKFYYDEEWLAIVRATHTFFTDSHTQTPLPSDSDVELHIQRELGWIRETLLRSPRVDPKVGYPIPDNFSQTAPVYDPSAPNRGRTDEVYLNRQTVEFCNMLQIPNRINPMGTMVSHTPLSNQDPSNLANLTAVGSVPLI
ncbi:hypothetical protein BASA61_008060 [Batrachochytrium salamandrivorans]|nr:hypothetical protein BASA61_008060 [Batrachochytrium salamandrivorans]